jgi:hypothetical protein
MVAFVVVVMLYVATILFATNGSDQLGLNTFNVEIFGKLCIGRYKPRRLAGGIGRLRISR